MNGKTARGFSLIELLAVLVLLGLLASHASLRFSHAGASLAGQADRLAADLMHARALAMGMAWRLRFEATGAGYRVLDDGLGTPVTDPATGREFVVALESGVTLGGGPVRFDSLGRPTDGSGTLLATAVDFVLSGDGRTRTVRVHPATGLAEVLP